MLLFVAITGWLVFGGHLPALSRLGIPTMQPAFADARTITGVKTTLEQGLDPLVSNPGDPWGRPMNYPRVWTLLAELGVGPQQTELLALAFFISFVIGLGLLVPLATTPAIAATLTAALFSPVAWMLVERGNSDLLLFGLLAAAACFAARHPRGTGLLVGAGAVLKLYPIFGVAALCTTAGRRALRTIAAMVGLFFGYVLYIHRDLLLIHANTEHWNRISYGIDKVPRALSVWTGVPMLVLLLAVVAGLLGVMVCCGIARCRVRLGAVTTGHSLSAFRVGAGVFVGTFCIGSNFDYRLVFLLLVVPQLTTWVTATRGPIRAAAVAVLANLLLLLWSMTWRLGLQRIVGGETLGLMIDEVVSWSLVVGLVAGLVLSLPDWLMPAAFRGTRFLDAPAVPARVLPLPVLPLPVAPSRHAPAAREREEANV